eukprot:sb/3460853/
MGFSVFTSPIPYRIQIVLYIAPSSEELKSKDDILKYLTSPGTCKCGLKCPLHLDSVFSFDAAIKSKEPRDSKKQPLSDKINRPQKDAVKGLPADHSCGLKTAPQITTPGPQQSPAPGNETPDHTNLPERNENETRFRPPPPPALPPISVFCQDNQYTHTQILQFLYTNLEMSLRSVSMHPEYQRQYRMQMMNHPGFRAQLMARQQQMMMQYRHLTPQQMQQLQAQQMQMQQQMQQQQQAGVSPQKFPGGHPPRPQLVPSPQLAGQRPMAPPPYTRLPKPNEKRSSKAPKKPSGMLQLVQSGPRNITPRPEKTKKAPPPPAPPPPPPPQATAPPMVVQQQLADKSRGAESGGKPTLFVSLQGDKRVKRSPGMGDGPLPSVDSLLKTCSTLNTLPDIDRGLSAAAAGRVDGGEPSQPNFNRPPSSSPHHPSPPRPRPGPSPHHSPHQTPPSPSGGGQYYPQQHPAYRHQNYHRLTLRPALPQSSGNSRPPVRHPNISVAHSTLPPNTTPNVQIAPSHNMVASVSYPGQQFFRHPGSPGYPHILGVPLNPPPKPASAKHSDKWEGVLSPSEVDAKVQEILSSPQKSDQGSAPATPNPTTTAATGISDKKRKRQQSAPQMFDRYPGNPFLRVGGNNTQPKAAKLPRVETPTPPLPTSLPAIAPAPQPNISPVPHPAISPAPHQTIAPAPARPTTAPAPARPISAPTPTSIIIGSSGALLTPPPGIMSMVKPPPATDKPATTKPSQPPPNVSVAPSTVNRMASPKITSPVTPAVSLVSSTAKNAPLPTPSAPSSVPNSPVPSSKSVSKSPGLSPPVATPSTTRVPVQKSDNSQPTLPSKKSLSNPDVAPSSVEHDSVVSLCVFGISRRWHILGCRMLTKNEAFELLKVPPTATEAEIKQAFRSHVIRVMPKATDDAQLHRATAAFMLLTGTDNTDWMDVLDSELGWASGEDSEEDYDTEDEQWEEITKAADDNAQKLVNEVEAEKRRLEKKRERRKKHKQRRKEKKREEKESNPKEQSKDVFEIREIPDVIVPASKDPASQAEKAVPGIVNLNRQPSKSQENSNTATAGSDSEDNGPEIDLGSAFCNKVKQKVEKAETRARKTSEKMVNGASTEKPKSTSPPATKKSTPERAPSPDLPDPPTEEEFFKSQEHARKGNEFAQTGRIHNAIEEYTKAIGLNKIDHRCYGNRSYCYHSLKRFQEAMEDAISAIKLVPNEPKGYFRKAKALCGLKRFSEAENALKKILELDPDCSEASHELFEVRLLQLQDFGFDRRACEHALMRSKNDIQGAIEFLLSSQFKDNMTFSCTDYDDSPVCPPNAQPPMPMYPTMPPHLPPPSTFYPIMPNGSYTASPIRLTAIAPGTRGQPPLVHNPYQTLPAPSYQPRHMNPVQHHQQQQQRPKKQQNQHQTARPNTMAAMRSRPPPPSSNNNTNNNKQMENGGGGGGNCKFDPRDYSLWIGHFDSKIVTDKDLYEVFVKKYSFLSPKISCPCVSVCANSLCFVIFAPFHVAKLTIVCR